MNKIEETNSEVILISVLKFAIFGHLSRKPEIKNYGVRKLSACSLTMACSLTNIILIEIYQKLKKYVSKLKNVQFLSSKNCKEEFSYLDFWIYQQFWQFYFVQIPKTGCISMSRKLSLLKWFYFSEWISRNHLHLPLKFLWTYRLKVGHFPTFPTISL